MIYTHCSTCGRRIPANTKCPCAVQIEKARQKQYDKNKRDRKRHAFYYSDAWMRVRDMCRAQCANLDLYALYEHGAMVPGRLVHHIIPIEEDWDRRFDIDNLICVSDASHHEIHQQYDRGSMEKADLQKKLRLYKKRFLPKNG